MAVSFGLAKKIIEHPSYNLGLALPFIAAFYLLNDTQPLVLPLIHYALSDNLSVGFKILGVTFYYILFVFMFVIAGGLSRFTNESSCYYGYPLLTLIVSLGAYFTQQGEPKFYLLFACLSAVFLLLVHFDYKYLSLLIVGAFGTLLSIFCFVAGVLWFENHLVFNDILAKLFGFASLTPDSIKIGWPMLITTGYIILYAVFQTGELWGD